MSFEIIPRSSNQNKSPVIHLEHNLGLEHWCVKYVYEFAHKAILASRRCKKQYCNTRDLIKYLNVALLINPDVATFWNQRRMLVEKNQLNLRKEFQFSAIVLSVKPKSNEAFAYRRWLYLFQSKCSFKGFFYLCLNFEFKELFLPGEESNDWTIELALCERCADKKTSSYHAWSHRQWVLDKAPHLLKFEMYKTEKYIRKHVSDYSCYHHRQHVLHTLYEHNYYELEEKQYKEITDLTNVILKKCINNQNELIAVLLPNVRQHELNDAKLCAFLYCMNYAAADIKFADELNYMFGASYAFESHRRAMVKFIVDVVRHANSTDELTIDCWQSSSKLMKIDANAENEFLLGLKELEGQRGEKHQRWCKIFLGFDYGDTSK